jgi:hypothetical protein
MMKTKPMNVVRKPQFDTPRAPEPTAEERFNAFVRRLQNKKEMCERSLQEWKEKRFDVNPAHAFTWSRDAFNHAAWLDVTAQLLGAVEDMRKHGHHDTWIHTELTRVINRTALQQARNVEQSSSPTANLIDDYTRAVWATLTDEYAFW